MHTLLKLAKLEPEQTTLGDTGDFPVIVEALKCLCNIVFNSPEAQKLSLELNMAAGLCHLLEKCSDGSTVNDIRCFDLRLLFLLTLLHTSIRTQLKQELHGLTLLTNTLESILSVHWVGKYQAATEENGPALPMQETDCTIEALKALFNVTLDSWNVHSEVQCLIFIITLMWPNVFIIRGHMLVTIQIFVYLIHLPKPLTLQKQFCLFFYCPLTDCCQSLAIYMFSFGL